MNPISVSIRKKKCIQGVNQAQMLAFYTVVWTMHSEDDRAFFQQLYIDYELMMFKKALTVLRNEEESLDAVSDACLMLMKRISTLRQLSDMSLRRYIIITVEHASINRLRRRLFFLPGTIATASLSDEAVPGYGHLWGH